MSTSINTISLTSRDVAASTSLSELAQVEMEINIMFLIVVAALVFVMVCHHDVYKYWIHEY